MTMKNFAGDLETMRKLGIKNRIDESSTQRITSQEIAALKTAVREVPAIVPLRVVLNNMLDDLGHALRNMFRGGAESNVCKRYGHAIDESTWSTLFPNCRDCGKTIRSQSELRTALPRVC